MSRNTIIQLIAFVLMVGSLAASGALLPGILQRVDQNVLRYTNVSVDGAPPIVVIGTAIGALRGLIVDYLWIKANSMKDKGLFYEAMADADLITKLQPRFAAVWTFHGHNMAYNISVATNTQEERWEWVNAGIRLVRNEGLRYNPNDLLLYRELAFWLSHKLEGVSDDAHLYYKKAFCREWHLLLGQPPEDTQAHLEWIKQIADAPETLEAAEQRTPGVRSLVEQLKAGYPKDDVLGGFKLNYDFLTEYIIWQSIQQQSAAAKILGWEDHARENWPGFPEFSALASDATLQAQWSTLISHVRKRVLIDEYNMDPRIMHRFEMELGVPIEWRHGQAHALYFARRGAELGEGRVSNEDVYIAINNDAQHVQAMQDLARYGRISFDPFSEEMPGRFPDPRWIDVISDQFDRLYIKYKDARGVGGERFIAFIQNFLSSAVCEWYRAGETQRAQKILDHLRERFSKPPNADLRFVAELREFVHNETFDQYQSQPHLAPRDVSASLGYGFRVGILYNRPDVLRDALIFAHQVTDWFKNNKWFDYTTKFGESRIADIIGGVENSAEIAYLQMITNPMLTLEDRQAIWANTDRIENEVLRGNPALLGRQTPAFRALVYDRAMPSIQQQFLRSELSLKLKLEEAFPAPPGLDQQREFLIKREQEWRQKMEEIRQRDPFAKQGSGNTAQ